ncbi:uncharacterized protein LOC121428260 [Lytechinus variegatus]|uniref:uncharacterized protein LOC121428260 n=1 Tax=Lytechinus variegatus TaxID=7654 RepID=UPI001BB14C2E|nr:uncharacterized protein LOC121428260 [Lytechinus variegatus]XP_041480789.1 uncharacterized protein LOC121428260 [Lytechinus variegatus]XP_041480791.1 uncharacterized protein LOC121428260 [Lytechinus variegatus]
MSQNNPALSQHNTLASTISSIEEKRPSLEMVSQDKHFQNLQSNEGKNMECQYQGKENLVAEEQAEEGEMSIRGSLLSQDVRADGWCQERDVGSLRGDLGLECHGDADVSMSGSLRSDNFDRNVGTAAICKERYKEEQVQKKLQDLRIAGEKVTREEDHNQERHCESVKGTDTQNLSVTSGHKLDKAVLPGEKTRIGDATGEKGIEAARKRQVGHSEQELEASLLPIRSSDNGQETFYQDSNKQSLDSSHSLHSSHSEPSMTTSQSSPTSSSKYSRSQSLQVSRKNDHYDILLIYTKEDERTCAIPFREYAASKDWKVTSTAELPIGPLSLKNFRKAMECCSYVVLLISSHFISDRACERHYNIAIQYGDKHPEFTDCVLPILFDSAELPPELDAIQHVTWDHHYFDNVMTKSIDVEKRLERELQEAAAATCTSLTHSRAISVDASLPTTSSFQYQMASTPPTLHTVPAKIPVPGTESPQGNTAAQQRVKEQEACLMPTDVESPILPPIPVNTTSDVVAKQGLQPGNAATTGGQAQLAANQHTIVPHRFDHSNMPQHQSLATIPCQPQSTFQQPVNAAERQYQPLQHPGPVASISQGGSGAVAQVTSQILQPQPPHQPLTNLYPAAYQPQSTYHQHVPVQYQHPHFPESDGSPHSVTSTSPVVQSQLHRTISHPSQDYANMTGEDILRSLIPELKPGQAATHMLSSTRFGKICELLDDTDVRGNDWRFLAEILDVNSSQMSLLEKNQRGKTRFLLEVFFLKNGMEGKLKALEELSKILKLIERHDAAEHVDMEIKVTKCRGR